MNRRIIRAVSKCQWRRMSAKPSTNDSFLSGSAGIYTEQMYDLWRKDPKSVHASWATYFQNLESGLDSPASFQAPPSSFPRGMPQQPSYLQQPQSLAGQNAVSTPMVSDSLGVSYLIRAYQSRGHEIANLDPLGLNSFRDPAGPPPELDYRSHGFKEEDLDRQLNFLSQATGGNKGFLDIMGSVRPNVTLRQILDQLNRTYCSSLGVEYMHMVSIEKQNWIREQVERPKFLRYSKEKKMHIFERLCFADHFEKFLANKFNTAKRFGLEGGESCIPGLKFLVDRGSELGIESFSVGMPHRGRLSVLANVMRKPFPQILKEFQGTHYDLDEYLRNDWSSAGDVKYHLGTSADRTYPDGRKVHMSLIANPSHLEAVNPVVVGKVRAKQYYDGNKPEHMRRHMPILLHGDASFAGQGVVYETMQMSKVPGFAVGGTVHVIVNNQVGFTTDPQNGRSTMYPSDLGKAFNIPIFHCNGDDPSAVVAAFEMAVEWRQQFAEDCIIDLVCYRRYGHNELDQPLYTQPQLYSKIMKHPDTLSVFETQLLKDKTCDKQELDAIKASVDRILENDLIASKTWVTPPFDWLSSRWQGFKGPHQRSRIFPTGLPVEKLRDIGLKISTIPSKFNAHKQLQKIFAAREETIRAGKGIDWGTAEALAFGTLLKEGNHVRLSGQDVQRGTFSHRHAVLKDQRVGSSYSPLNNICKHISPTLPGHIKMHHDEDLQAEFHAHNSILSEFGVLGFECGFSLENPNALVLWEAQFGDFANGAQIIIDQFISAGEDKWLRQSGITLLLPHGYMGQGAEHSSCRIERFLQQVEEDEDVIPPMAEDVRMQIQTTNWQVVNCSTPANYYHVLRRQVHREFRKPLIVASPKNLLRDRRCVSSLEDMGENTSFKRIYEETDTSISSEPEKVRSVVYCSGKVYYELLEEREKNKRTDVAIIRIEQLAPFPWDRVAEQAALYKNAKSVWCQEEPKNMGAWSYVQPRFATSTRMINKNEQRLAYVGRRPSSAVATGLGARAHAAEQESLVKAAFD